MNFSNSFFFLLKQFQKQENMRLREELEEYKRREREEKLNIPLQVTLEVEKTTKEIEAKIEERQRLDEQLEREKEQRALQLAIARENKRHLNINTKLIENEQPHVGIGDVLLEDDNEDEELPPEKLQQLPMVPQFDRSVKPQLTARQPTPPQSGNNYALQRQRDFSPVSGAMVSLVFV